MGGCVALVVAAGRGERFGGEIPKQYRMVAGQAMLRHALLPFVVHPQVGAVRVAIDADHRRWFEAATAGLALLEPVIGGATRQESARRGLESLSGLAPERVLIHDAARPCVAGEIISRVLTALDHAPAAVPAVPVGDTLKRAAATVDAGGHAVVAQTVDRTGLWRAQTPQGFRYRDILDAHRRCAGLELTDDAAVAQQAGLAVALVAGSEDNLKVTAADDLGRAERLLGGGSVRTGIGFDVHRFGPGDHLMLCGVAIPFGFGLEGHSDADVGLHALTDALFGAIGAGDLGTHFPPGEAEWRAAPSEIFLRRAGELVAGRRGVIANLDVTLICERPRIGPHRAAMIQRIAAILGLPPDRVSVKATTTDRLGFAGRGEGIAAQAVATVRLPG